MEIIKIFDIYGKVLFQVEADSKKDALQKAIASGANLSGAKNIESFYCTPLLMLLDQPGSIRAYKLVTADGIGPFNGGITYRIGESYEVSGASADVTKQCGPGINLATLDWCMKKWVQGYRILIAEFMAVDIAAIPTAIDGKFRIHRCSIVGEKNLIEIGLIKEPEKVSV